ncbi:MAG: tryptophan--tRNA ligase, partial [Candidatus Aenigmarchaeota archaeon]|nr:tryptophan--tRNA ligase [Candidatus Aenigmarchaeota archaeon]
MILMTMKVTPWEVSGHIDYEKLISQFGTSHITSQLLERLEKAAGESHFMLRRRIFFSHRDLDWLLDKNEKGEKFALYTGRGPSGDTHLGHLMPWIFCKWLQDAFDAELYFQITDDEKFLKGGADAKLGLEDTNKIAYENALEFIALGFDPKKTFLFVDTDYANTMYKIAVKAARFTTFSTAKAVFGFDNSTNVGMAFYPSMQIATCFLPSVLKGKNVPVLIPAAIDQDPYWRIARDVAERLGYYKPAAIHNTFMPGLKGIDSKMSASIPDSAIFTTDTPEDARKKIGKAFSGGAATLEEHKRHGGNPDVDVACIYLRSLFEPDDKKLGKIISGFRSGAVTSGDIKGILAEKVGKFLKEHQKKRKSAKKHIHKYFLHEVP